MFNIRPMPRRVLGGLGTPVPIQRPFINPGQPSQMELTGNVPAGSPTTNMGIDEAAAGAGSSVLLPGQGQPQGNPVLQQQAIQALLSKAAQSQAGRQGQAPRMAVQGAGVVPQPPDIQQS